eukprot:scaffold204733_cov17-Tisochrysis_lutea.AAC.4
MWGQQSAFEELSAAHSIRSLKYENLLLFIACQENAAVTGKGNNAMPMQPVQQRVCQQRASISQQN